MLARLEPRLLPRVWFPLGDQRKDETRAEAARGGIGGGPTAGVAGGVLPRGRRLPVVPRAERPRVAAGTGHRRARSGDRDAPRPLGLHARPAARARHRRARTALRNRHRRANEYRHRRSAHGARADACLRARPPVPAGGPCGGQASLPLPGDRGRGRGDVARVPAGARRTGVRCRQGTGRRAVRRRPGGRFRLGHRQSPRVVAFSAGDAAYVGLAVFLVAVGLAGAWALLRLAETFDRLSSLLRGTERDLLPVATKLGGTVDRVNAQLDKLDPATDSAVDAVVAADRAVRTLSFAISRPVQKLTGLSSGRVPRCCVAPRAERLATGSRGRSGCRRPARAGLRGRAEAAAWLTRSR